MSIRALLTTEEVVALETATFSRTLDPADPRFEIVTWRRVAAEQMAASLDLIVGWRLS